MLTALAFAWAINGVFVARVAYDRAQARQSPSRRVENRQADRKFCLTMALGGPLSVLIFLAVSLIDDR